MDKSTEAVGRENMFETHPKNGIRTRVKVFWRLSIGILLFWGFKSISQEPEDPTPIQSGINWKPCGHNIECGHLSVPLDYNDISLGTANLSVARYRATNHTARLGTLFTNPGGPGGSGVNFIYLAGPRISDVVDGRYDIVSWDPRGMNGTTPRIESFDTQTEQDLYFVHTHRETQVEGRNLSNPVDLAVFTASVRRADAENAALTKLCIDKSGETLRYIGTPTVVRDLDLLSRTIEGDQAPVNYWGFSYGTIIGSYFVNMFPDRVGRVIIDGVVDPVMWATTHINTWYKYDLMDTDRVFENFLKACMKAVPGLCALRSGNSSASSIGARIDKLLNDLYDYPLPVHVANRPGVLTSGMVRGHIFTNMYKPRDWPTLAKNLDAAIQGNGTAILNSVQNDVELDKSIRAETSPGDAVTCVDTLQYPPDVDKAAVLQKNIDEMVLTYEIASKRFGTMLLEMCHHWTPRETERFTGPFNSSLSNKILIIGNTADPITPLLHAKTVNRLLHNDSRLIIQDGSGHGSIAMASLCTGDAIRNYFFHGKLPPNGIVCPTDENLFPAPENATEEATWMNTTNVINAGDRHILEKFRALGKEMQPFLTQWRR